MYPASLKALIESFRRLPGVGEKTAERYALLVHEMDEESVRGFAQALVDVKTQIGSCRICGNLTEEEECEICRDPDRERRLVMVVQSPKDIIAVEKTGEYKGVYHVLNGQIAASKGVLPEDLNIASLIERLPQIDEVILATSATLDGETTAMYLDRLIKKNAPDVLVTRIAHGLPSGGMLDYADEMTLIHALSDRKKME